MKCKDCLDNLTAYTDRELSFEEEARVASHLKSCRSCAQELKSLEEATAMVQSNTRELEIRPQLWLAVSNRISTESPRPPVFYWFVKAASIPALVVALTLLIGYLTYDHIRKRDLDDYISQYMKYRETVFNMQNVNAFGSNPFMEIKPGPDANPFQSEAR